jgi:transcriptional regulator with XRE-family HTH domain
VAEMRHERKVKQATLAKRVGLSASHLSNMEYGRSAPPTEEVARRLARELWLSPSETKTFVAEANLARSQWHVERVRSRARARAEHETGTPDGCADARDRHEAAEPELALRVTSLDGTSRPMTASSLTEALIRGSAGVDDGGDGHCEAARWPPGAFSIAAQTVRLDIDLPQIGAACLEIDVSAEGSDCRLSMRVVPRTLQQGRRP